MFEVSWFESLDVKRGKQVKKSSLSVATQGFFVLMSNSCDLVLTWVELLKPKAGRNNMVTVYISQVPFK